MAVRTGGRGAQTRFYVLERFGDWTLVEAVLLTGTHQLRVHFISIGHPVAATLIDDWVQPPDRQASNASSCTPACCVYARRTTTSSTCLSPSCPQDWP